jgi:hypothetical protein
MVDWIQLLARSDVVDWRTAAASLLLSFGLAQVVAGTYIATFRGLSYSRSFVQSMAMGGIITCMLMLAIGNSIPAGIGIAGGLAIIRFRTTMRDPRDMVFVFAALAVGIATGLRAYSVAILGVVVFCGAALALHVSAYGATKQFDGLLRFVASHAPECQERVASTLRDHCRFFTLVTLRDAAGGGRLEHCYQIRIADPDTRAVLVSSLQGIADVQSITLMMQEPTLDL